MTNTSRIPSAYVFVGTPATFWDSRPFRLSPRAVLRRASDSEIEKIKSYLDSLSGIYPCTGIFESSFKNEIEQLGADDKSIELVYREPTAVPRENWNYNVVFITRYEGNPLEDNYSDLTQLRVSSQLSSCPLFLNTVTSRNSIHSLDFAADWHHYTNPTASEYKVTSFERHHLEDWKEILRSVERIKASFPLVWHSLKLFSEVPLVKGHNELTVLALFSVLESVITHNPRGEFDSIGHQIRTKIALVENRADLKLDYSVLGNTPPETIWKKLYELRSNIAHGSPVSFSGKLKVLDDAYIVERFMFSVLKTILRFAVKEPQLVTDLKAV